jgi:hypothetical protein
MTYETKKQERERFIAGPFGALPLSQSVLKAHFCGGYMRHRKAPGSICDVFRDADVVSIDELRAARKAALIRDNNG